MAFRAAKIDANQPAIVTALEHLGASVQSLARVGVGCPDLLVGYQGKNFILEVKNRTGGGMKLTHYQQKWRNRWHGDGPRIVSTVAEAFNAIGVEINAETARVFAGDKKLIRN